MFTRMSHTTGSTLPYRLFKKHHTEIHQLYWSHMLVAKQTLNAVKKKDKRTKPTTVFPVSRKLTRYIAPTLDLWEQDFKDFNNWVRLSAAVAINSYMEIYLRKISTLAIESNPGILIGAPGAIDGVKLLKSRNDYHYSEYAVHFVKGDWNTRVAHYERLFGKAPTALKEHVKELNELRKMRNGVGHSFGRSVDDYEHGLPIEVKPMMRLSEERFVQWLRMADEVALAVDDHLRAEHIGEYEMLVYYHTWLRRSRLETQEDEAAALMSSMADEMDIHQPLEYARGLIRYYRES